MKTILIPTDFSSTARNAAHYGLSLARQLHIEKIILYNAYQTTLNFVADPMVPALGVLDIESIKDASIGGLKRFKREIVASGDADGLVVETLSEFNLLAEGIDELCARTQIDLIVMGITGGGEIKENLIGSNTINVAKNTKIPVIIVPPQAGFKKIQKIMFVCDFRKVVDTIPETPIKNILKKTKASLTIFHVEQNEKENEFSEKPFESLMVDTIFEEFHPEFHIANDSDFTEAINDFALSNNINLIIAIPKKRGLLDTLFRKSHTKMLAFHSRIPLMVIH